MLILPTVESHLFIVYFKTKNVEFKSVKVGCNFYKVKIKSNYKSKRKTKNEDCNFRRINSRFNERHIK